MHSTVMRGRGGDRRPQPILNLERGRPVGFRPPVPPPNRGPRPHLPKVLQHQLRASTPLSTGADGYHGAVVFMDIARPPAALGVHLAVCVRACVHVWTRARVAGGCLSNRPSRVFLLLLFLFFLLP